VQRRRLVPALLAVVVLALSACSSTSGGGGTGAGNAGSQGPFPSVTGVFGDKAELAFPGEDPAADLQVSVLSEGDGPAVEAGDLVLAHYLGQVWDGHVFDNSYDRGGPSAFPIGAGGVIEGWDTGLVGQQVGSRVLLSIPPELGYGEEGNAGLGIGGSDTLAFVVDIVDAFGPQAAGDPDAEPTESAASLALEIEGALGSPAAISVPAGTPEPTEISTTLLASAGGDPVVAGDLVIQYAATFWDNTDGESTWELGQATTVPVGAGGAFDGLVGFPVGSRALVQLPATGEQAAIAVVVDVLAQSGVS
jgi:peptidylprolyl isomerase